MSAKSHTLFIISAFGCGSSSKTKLLPIRIHTENGVPFRLGNSLNCRCAVILSHDIYGSISRKSANPVISSTSMAALPTFFSFKLFSFFIAFCALSSTRSPADDIYSSFSRSSTIEAAFSIVSSSCFSSCGAVTGGQSVRPERMLHSFQLSFQY